MSRDGNGTYTAPVNSWNPAINGVLATAGDYQALLNDIVAALTQSVSRDGQSPMTGPLNMGNNKISGVTAGTGTGEALAFQQLFAQGTQADLASASTTDIGLQNTTFLRITGNTTITSFGSNYRGPRFLVFEGAVTLTNSATLVLPGGANITTAAGDVLIAIPGATLGTADKWIVTSYQKANTAPGYANIPGGFGFRNRIINGDMRIDQRNAGASVTVNAGAAVYTLDRWAAVRSTAGSYAVQQSATVPSGFASSLGITNNTAGTPAAGDFNFLSQVIEGFNVSDLGWGTASAQAVTLSLQVRASATGTYGGCLRNAAGNRSYPFTFTVAAANTFELKSITIPGDTTGTWLTTNGKGIEVDFDLGSGATFRGTAGAWASGNFVGATGASQNMTLASGATFYITGVQLEAGTVATPFERRDYGRELMMCQRYYQLAGAAASGSTDNSATVLQLTEKLAVPMRTAPTGSVATGGYVSVRINGVDVNNGAPSLANFSASTNTAFWTQVLGFVGQPVNAVVTGRNTATGNNFVALSAEL